MDPTLARPSQQTPPELRWNPSSENCHMSPWASHYLSLWISNSSSVKWDKLCLVLFTEFMWPKRKVMRKCCVYTDENRLGKCNVILVSLSSAPNRWTLVTLGQGPKIFKSKSPPFKKMFIYLFYCLFGCSLSSLWHKGSSSPLRQVGSLVETHGI